MLDCTLQAYKACPASRQKKESRVSNRDLSGLMDEGKLLKQGPGVTPHCVWQKTGRT